MLGSPRTEESIFAEALERSSPEARAAFLDGACGQDAALRGRVDNLLKSHEGAGSFLRSPLAATVDQPRLTERPGTLIGPYKLLQQIGEGGMGIVYMAEQERPVRRKVALKIIKPGMDSEQVLARFEAERQALAMMDHQNIARVFDAGTTDASRPYFVMELVHGVPITKFCDDNQLTPRQRLELFVPVCQAIQHAHQKGIIHRDIKPSNVLVTMYDDKPVPKVIDFGVAKAVEQRLTDKTLFTQFGTLLGTFEYMSPEQAEMNAFGVDTRSDVYSLGVLLYELLTGTTPLERSRLRDAALGEMVRLIKEEEPPRPSARLSSSGTLAKIAAARKTEPGQLSRLVRGELDWIVMKSLEKDRTRRYETANGLARDVERYLKDEPVEACPPSAGYKLKKFARKYKKALVTAGTIAALLVLGTAVSVWQALRARSHEDVAVLAQGETAAALKESQDLAKLLQEEKEILERRRYVSDMRLAQVAGDQGDLARLRELLAPHRPKRPGDIDRRGFEWYYWDRIAAADSFLTIKAHSNSVFGLAFSQDSRRLASCSHGDNTIKIWDPTTGRNLLKITSGGQCLAFSPDGRRLASAGWYKTVRLWDADTGRKLLEFEAHDGGIYRVTFSPDGQLLASASDDKTVKIWNALTGQLLHTLNGHGRTVRGVAFSPNGQWLASAGMDNTVKVWDPSTGENLRTLRGHAGWIGSVAFSPSSQELASGATDGTVRIWDPATGKLLQVLPNNAGQVASVAFSPDGRRLAVGRMNNSVQLWDWATGQQIQTFYGHALLVMMVAFSPDGKWLASGSTDRTVKIWDLAGEHKGQKVLAARGHTDEVVSVVFSPDGRQLASGSNDKTIKIWDAATGKNLGTLKGDALEVETVAFSRDGRLASASRDKTIKIWNLGTGTAAFTLDGGSRIAFSPDGRLLASGHWSKSADVKIWDVSTGKQLRTLNGPFHGVNSLIFSPDGGQLATGNSDSTARIWNPVTGKKLLVLQGHTDAVLSVAFSPDGRQLASASKDGTIKVWNLDTGKALLSLEGHSHSVIGVAFSPDGRRLASAGQDAAVKLWDLATGLEVLSFNRQVVGHYDFGGVAFSPDGRRLSATWGYSFDVFIWDAMPRAGGRCKWSIDNGGQYSESMRSNAVNP